MVPAINIADLFLIPKEAMFNLLGFSIIASSWISARKRTFVFENKWFGIILIWIIVSFVWNYYRPIVFATQRIARIPYWTVRPTINTILGLFLIKTLIENTDTLEKWVTIAKILCWLCFGFAIYTIIQNFELDQLWNFKPHIHFLQSKYNKQYLVTLTGNHFLTANFIALLSPLCLMFKEFRYKIIYAISFIAILLCYSALSVGVFAAVFLLYLFLTKKYLWFLGLSVFSVIGLIFIYIKYPDYVSANYRLWLWPRVLSACKSRFFTGYGLGQFAFRSFSLDPKGEWGNFHAVHNEFLQLLYSNGIVIIVFVIGYFQGLFRRILRVEKNMLLYGYICGLVSFLLISMGSFPLRMASMALVGILYISALEVQTQGV